MLQKLGNIFGPMAEEKKLFFNMSINDRVPSVVYQDEQRLGQVLVNIIGNAVKFTFNGSVSVNIDVFEEDTKKIKIVIRDTGKGIERLETVGQMFGNLEVLERVNQNGIGFGLSISKRLVEKLGGTISFLNV